MHTHPQSTEADNNLLILGIALFFPYPFTGGAGHCHWPTAGEHAATR
jgi:hypothetical protein